MRRLALHLLGTFEATLDGKPITGFKTEKARALLIYLAVERGHAHRRQSLVGLLWPDYPEGSARANLRQVLTNMRQVLRDKENQVSFLLVEGETIQLNPESDIWLDVAEFERSSVVTASKDLESAMNLYRGGFLEGFSLKDSPEFDSWTATVRERYQGMASATLGRLGEHVEQDKDYEKAIVYARKRLELEPWQEQAHRQLMRLLALSGQRAAALGQYEACRKSLKGELGVEPSAETRQLYESIRDGEVSVTKREKIRQHNLPVQLTSFIGREKEIAQVKELLTAHRLVTLTGAGGVGKTRLALQAAEGMLDQYLDGVWLVNLALISDPEQLVATTGRAMGVYADASPQALEKLIEYLHHRYLLLVLDNCEHVIEACAYLAEALLKSCSKIKILATSRERLGIAGEFQYYLPSLSVPNMEDQPALEQISQYEAVRLFVERAVFHQPGFLLTEQNAQAVGRICAQLDGIPLALELAAPWVRLLPVEQISRRLKENIDFLRGTVRTALPRSQTLRGCLDWSYALLSQGEQELLQALSVFVGGWTLEAAEAVCTDSCTSEVNILNLIDQLAGKSLVVVEQNEETEIRYRLLEPVRQYAQEKLFQAGKTETLRDRHQIYFQDLAVQAAPHLRKHQMINWLRRLERELPNLRQALDWAYTEDGSLDRLERGLHLAANLRFFWWGRNRVAEGIQWLIKLLDMETLRRGDQPLVSIKPQMRANALLEVVILYLHSRSGYQVTNFNHILNCLEESSALFTQLGEGGRPGLACTRFAQTMLSAQQRRWVLLEQLLPEFEALDDKFWMAECLANMGVIASIENEFKLAEKYWQRSLKISQEVGDWDIIPWQQSQLGKIAFYQGDLEKARDWAAQARRSLVGIEADLPFSATVNYGELGVLAWMMGDNAQAEVDFRKQFNITERSHLHLLQSRVNLCALWLSQGDYAKTRIFIDEVLVSTPWMKELFLFTLGELEWGNGNYSQARRMFTERLQLSDLGYDDEIYTVLGLAKVALSEQCWQEAAQHLDQALMLQIQTPFLSNGPYEDNYAGITLAAILALSQGHPDIAARLLGAAIASYQRYRLTFPLYRRQFIEQAMDAARAALNEIDFTKAWEEGKALDLKQALEYALQVVNDIQRNDIVNISKT